MTVAELKSKLPGCEIVELSPDFRYIVLVDPAFISRSAAIATLSSLQGIRWALVLTDDVELSMRVFEVKP